MGEEKPRKKGHSVGLGKVVGIVVLTLFVGMILGGYLSFAVVGPELQKMGVNIGFLSGNSNNDNNQNSNNNNNVNSNSPNDNNNNNNNNPNDNNQNNNNNDNNNQNQPSMTNSNPSPNNVTAVYGGNGQFQVSMQSDGNSYSGTLTASINVPVQQDGNTIEFSLELTPTSVSGSLSQVIQTDGSSGTVFNFVGTTSGTQLTANAQGDSGNGLTFDLNLSGTIDSNTFSFTMTSAGDSQLHVSTPHQIVTNSTQ